MMAYERRSMEWSSDVCSSVLAMGGRQGYSAATGILMLLLTWFGVVALMMAVIPAVALLPILLYIGMLIGAQAFQESPHKHAPAVVLAIVPTIAPWGTKHINNAQIGRASVRERVC